MQAAETSVTGAAAAVASRAVNRTGRTGQRVVAEFLLAGSLTSRLGSQLFPLTPVDLPDLTA